MATSDGTDRRNYLRISSDSFSLELEGDPAFILETYDNVRQDILRRLIDLIRKAEAAAAHGEEASTLTEPMEPVGTTPELPADARVAPDSTRVRAANAQNYVWVYITHDIYNKVYVVDLDSFMGSPFSRFLDGRRLRKLYVSRDQQDSLGALLHHGKTLWSELTERGREQLGGTEK